MQSHRTFNVRTFAIRPFSLIGIALIAALVGVGCGASDNTITPKSSDATEASIDAVADTSGATPTGSHEHDMDLGMSFEGEVVDIFSPDLLHDAHLDIARTLTPDEPLSAEDRALLAAQLVEGRAVAAAYRTAADAIAGGYRLIVPYVPLIGAHYVKPLNFRDGFDVSNPEILLYDGNGPEAHIVGLNYLVRGVDAAPEGFVGPNDGWHRHIGLCISKSSRMVVGSETLSDEECAERGGERGVRLNQGDASDGPLDNSDSSDVNAGKGVGSGWMMHAWVVPGWESSLGVFSAYNIDLQCFGTMELRGVEVCKGPGDLAADEAGIPVVTEATPAGAEL